MLSLRKPVTHRLCLAAAAVAASSILIGCGSDGASEASDGGAKVLSKDQAKSAVLSLENLGNGWERTDSGGSDDEDSDDEGLGCLTGLNQTRENANTKAEQEFQPSAGASMISLGSMVSSFDSEDEVIDRMASLREILAGCTSIKEGDASSTIELALVTDETKTHPEADEQLTLRATGSASAEGMKVPMAMAITVARVDNNVAFLAYQDMAATTPAIWDDITKTAVQRLVDVLDGKTPSDTVIPGAAMPKLP